MSFIKKRTNILRFSFLVCLLSSVRSFDLNLDQATVSDGFFYILFKVLLNEPDRRNRKSELWDLLDGSPRSRTRRETRAQLRQRGGGPSSSWKKVFVKV